MKKKVVFGFLVLLLAFSATFASLVMTSEPVAACDGIIDEWYAGCIGWAGISGPANYKHLICLKAYMDYCGY